MTSTPTRPVDNVVIATKGLQDRNINILAGTTVENKGKLIFTANTLASLLLQLMKATVLAENSFIFSPSSLRYVISTDVSQVGSLSSHLSNIFFIISPFQVFLLY